MITTFVEIHFLLYTETVISISSEGEWYAHIVQGIIEILPRVLSYLETKGRFRWGLRRLI